MTTQTEHTIIRGDSRCMQELKNKSVQLVITSPPYWQLKDYGGKEQIGFNDSYEDYINYLNLVWKECYRVLENGCRLCVNIGDQFTRTAYYGRYKVIPIREEIIRFCECLGFDYMGAIIWQKRTTTNTTGGASLMGSYPCPRNGILSIDYEFILLFKKLGTPKPLDKELKEKSKMTKEEWKEYFAGHWNFVGAKQKSHIAMFPEELPKRLIKMFAFVGDTVLDPFAGSGTTSLAAKNFGRNSVGYEINGEFIPHIKEKLQINQPGIFGKAEYDFVEQGELNIDFKDKIKKLRYRYKDYNPLRLQIDPKDLQFGSKLDKNSPKREKYFTVKEIISPVLVRLSNGDTVHLAGIEEDPAMRDQAIAFLAKKTRKQQVYLRHDDKKKFANMQHDKDNNPYGYLYLKNKTFLNAHLIKQNLVTVDEKSEYSRKRKFLKLIGRE